VGTSVTQLAEAATLQSPHRPGRLGKACWPDGNGPTVIDIFAGGGGLSLGFRSAGFRVVAALDKDPVAATVYRANAPEVPFIGPTKDEPIRGDIEHVSGSSLLELANVVPGTLGMLIGGPPCQGYSEIGRRRPEDSRNTLYRHFVRLLKELRPQGYLFENVPGLLSMRDDQGNKVIDVLMAAFREAGYSAEMSLVDAVTYGIPQYRKRLFIVGTQDNRHVSFPEGTYTSDNYVTVQDALGDLPSSVVQATAQLHTLPYGTEAQSAYAKLLRGESKIAMNCAPTGHTAEVQRRIKSVLPGGTDTLTRHRRLEVGKPAWTLRAGTRRRTACRPLHPVEQRVITVREAARLGSFPDDFWLPDGKAPAHMIIGNSVPPLLAYRLALILARQIFDRVDQP